MRTALALAAAVLLGAARPAAAQFPCPTCIINQSAPQQAQINIGTATVRGALTASTATITYAYLTNLTITNLLGSGALLTNLNASALASGTVSSTTLTGPYYGVTGLGTISSGTWHGTAVGTQYGGTGQNFVAVSSGSIPYFSNVGTMGTFGPGVAGNVLQSNGQNAPPSWTSSPTVTGARLTAVPLTALSAGTLGANVAVTTNSIAATNGSSVIGDIPGNAANMNGTLALNQLGGGVLGANITAQSLTLTGVSSGTYGGPYLLAQIHISTDGRVTSAAQYTLPTTQSASTGAVVAASLYGTGESPSPLGVNSSSVAVLNASGYVLARNTDPAPFAVKASTGYNSDITTLGAVTTISSATTQTSSATFTNAAGVLVRSTATVGYLAAGGGLFTGGVVAASTLTVQGSAFSVGGSSFTVGGGSATVAYAVIAGSFVGNGANLTGLQYATEATNASLTGNGTFGSPLGVNSSSVAVLGATGLVPNALLDSSSATLQGNAFNAAAQLVKLDANGAEQLAGSLTASTGTFTSKDAAGYSLTLSSGILASAGTVRAAHFAGDGAALTGIAASAFTGGQVAGQTTFASTVTIKGNAFSVGGSSFTVTAGSATVAFRLTAGSFVGNGANLTSLAGANVTGNIGGNAAGITGTIAASQVFPGALNPAVIASSWATHSSLNLTGSAALITTQSSVTASAFFGDGSHLGGITSTPGNTVTSSFTVTSSSGILATSSVTASAYFGDGSHLANVTATSITVTGVVPNTYGDATHVGAFTVGTDGRLTAANSVAITGNATYGNAVGAPTPSVYADVSGNVGVGTTSPGATFNVAGEILGTSSVTAGAYYGYGGNLTGISGTISGGVTGVLPAYTNATTLGLSTLFSSASSATATGAGGFGVAYGLTASTAMITGQETVGSTLTVQGNAFGVGASTFVVTGGAVGVGTSSPNNLLTVSGGNIVFYPFGGVGSKADLFLGQGQTGDDIYIHTFRQSNSSPAGLELDASSFTFTSGPVSIAQGLTVQSTASIAGSAFSVGGSTFSIGGGSATVAYAMTAGSYYGDGSHLTGIAGSTARPGFLSGNNYTLGVGTFQEGYSAAAVTISTVSVIITAQGSGGTTGTVWGCCYGGSCAQVTSSAGAAIGSTFRGHAAVAVPINGQITLQMISTDESVTPSANVTGGYQ